MYSLKFKCAGHVQSIERAESKAGGVAPRQLHADFKREVWKTHLGPNPCRAVGVEIRPHSLGLRKRQLTPEDVLLDGLANSARCSGVSQTPV